MRGRRYIPLFKDIPSPRQKIPQLSVQERVGNFDEVEGGFSVEAAMREARRCLGCRACLGCGLCLAECPAKAIVFDQVEEEIHLTVDSVIMAPLTPMVALPLDGQLGYGRLVNVVSGVEFERILSDSGPYGGLLLRPYDGEIPTNIAFIQWAHPEDVESGPRSWGYALKEAIAAQARVKDLEVCMFFADLGRHERAVEESLGGRPRISRRRGRVVAVREVARNRNVVIEWTEDSEGSEIQREEFEMAVLATAPAEGEATGNEWMRQGVNCTLVDPVSGQSVTAVHERSVVKRPWAARGAGDGQ